MRFLILLSFLAGQAAWSNDDHSADDSCERLLEKSPQISEVAAQPAQSFLGELAESLSSHSDLHPDFAALNDIRSELKKGNGLTARKKLSDYLDRRAKIYSETSRSRARSEIIRILAKDLKQLASEVDSVPAQDQEKTPEEEKTQQPDPSNKQGQGDDKDESGDQSESGEKSQEPNKNGEQKPNDQSQQPKDQGDKSQSGDQEQRDQQVQSKQARGEEKNQSNDKHKSDEQSQQSTDQGSEQKQDDMSQNGEHKPSDKSQQSKDPNKKQDQGGKSQNGDPKSDDQSQQAQDQESKQGQGDKSQNSESKDQGGKPGQGDEPQSGEGKDSKQGQGNQSKEGKPGGQPKGGQPQNGETPSPGQGKPGGQSSKPQGKPSSSPGQSAQSGEKQAGGSEPKGSDQSSSTDHSQNRNGDNETNDKPADSNKGKTTQHDPSLNPEPDASVDPTTDNSKQASGGGRSEGKTGFTPIETEAEKLWREFEEKLNQRNDIRELGNHPEDKFKPKNAPKDKDSWLDAETKRRKQDDDDGFWRKLFGKDEGKAAKESKKQRQQREKRQKEFARNSKWNSLKANIDGIKLRFLTKTLPAAVLRQSYLSSHTAAEAVTRLNQFYTTVKGTYGTNGTIVDELSVLQVEFKQLQEMLVMLGVDYQSLSEVAASLNGLKPELSPAVLNSLSGVEKLLTSIRTKSELNPEEENLLKYLQMVTRFRSETNPDDSVLNNNRLLGRTVWDLLPGPISKYLLREELADLRSTDENEFMEQIGRKLNDDNDHDLDFYTLLVRLSPLVNIRMQEKSRPKLMPFPIDRKNAEHNESAGMIAADDMALWPKVPTSPYPMKTWPALIEAGELAARQALQQRHRSSPVKPKKIRSSIALLDVSESMDEHRFVIRNILNAIYIDSSFKPVVYDGDELAFYTIPFDGSPHEAELTQSIPDALKLMTNTKERPGGSGQSTAFLPAFKRAMELIKESISNGESRGLLGETSNILLITDGVDPSFHMTNLKEMKDRILGPDFPLKIDVFSIDDGNPQFAKFEEMRPSAGADAIPLSYVHIDPEQMFEWANTASVNLQFKQKFLESLKGRASMPLRLPYTDRGQLARALQTLQNVQTSSKPNMLIDKGDRLSWNDFVAQIPDATARDVVKQYLSSLLEFAGDFLTGSMYQQALDDLYNDIDETLK